MLSVKSLRELSAKVVSNMSKQVLNCALAEIIWSEKYEDWKLQTRVSQNCYIEGIGISREWFYHPEYSTNRSQLEVKCIDATHLLTRTRRKCCKGGLDGITNEAWKAVAKTGNTFLTPIMVEEITDPMSSAMAATHFSEDVEEEMYKLGYTDAANLCKDVRLWWEAEDCSGFSALERFTMRENLRQRLLSHVKFNKYPPPSKYVAGWPLQLWEALIAHIDAKTLLYSLCHGGTCNVRAFSSLVGETFFSELVLHDKTGCGTVTAAEFGRFIGAASEQLHVRHDPNRKFVYRTGRSHVYELSGSEVTTSDSSFENDECSACLPMVQVSKITLK
ncbi:uncharacterized protein LOC132721103 [Ruditapes philippinarum]|uniref:uncharacterized protein LOC132721103 n=1 Tax=Ruditapes philippinarum TaxID=129788 RepID=UPI00295C3572|nr:uncharacterized protein LOC132721103 [Ruditapes philippinarum]